MADQTLAQSGALKKPLHVQQDAKVFENEGVRVRRVENCLLCGKQGQPLYADLRDRLFDAPGVWSISRCQDCGLVWLNPKPISEDVHKLYKSYYTHENGNLDLRRTNWRPKLMDAIRATTLGYKQLLPGAGWYWVGRAAALIPLLRDNATGSLMFLTASRRGTLLDVGCGSGGFLAMMRGLGWDVQGIEPDPEAARIARETRKLTVISGTLEGARLPPASFDAVTTHHVVEHVPDPVALMAECRRILRPGGRLVMITPNSSSLGHAAFGKAWFALDPPRHLHIFTARALRRAAESAKLEIKALRTMSRGSRDAFIYSRLISREGSINLDGTKRYGRTLRLGGWSFWAVEETARLVVPYTGEELILVADKPNG
ncbi:MAG TPA: class I SAM-dependent methyltransferase [Terriglobia bacterium]|nr:class I SAM-dependent methyltransferase [Terriglobia bacterium]